MFDVAVNLFKENDRLDADSPVVQTMLADAVAAGVRYLLLPGSTAALTERYCRAAAALAAPCGSAPVHCCVAAGVHPACAHTFQSDGSTVTELRRLLDKPAYRAHVVAVGECGLDYARLRDTTVDQQRACFAAQCALAAEYGLPLYLHVRGSDRPDTGAPDAYTDLLAILDSYISQIPRVLVRCFTGSLDHLRAFVLRGCFIGITGIVCMENRGQALATVVPYVPPHKLVIETGTPYLHPSTEYLKQRLGARYRPQPSAPRHLYFVLRRIAEIVGAPVKHLRALTTANAKTFCGTFPMATDEQALRLNVANEWSKSPFFAAFGFPPIPPVSAISPPVVASPGDASVSRLPSSAAGGSNLGDDKDWADIV